MLLKTIRLSPQNKISQKTNLHLKSNSLQKVWQQSPPFNSINNQEKGPFVLIQKFKRKIKNSKKKDLGIGEEEPYRSTQNKNFIPKCMFMAAISRPTFGENGECLFDGKIGIWPFTEFHIAKRNSVNRNAGTVEEKAIQSVTRLVIRQTIIEKLIPAVKAKWPYNHITSCIWIQQDNARPHILPDDPEFLAVANSDGFQMKLICQPPQSPDLNCLDLGFFRALQSLQQQKFPKDTAELVKAVKEAFKDYEPSKLRFTWIQLQYVMLEILKMKGGNNYKNPHRGKSNLERMGQLPFQVEVPESLLNESLAILNEGIISIETNHDIAEESEA